AGARLTPARNFTPRPEGGQRPRAANGGGAGAVADRPRRRDAPPHPVAPAARSEPDAPARQLSSSPPAAAGRPAALPANLPRMGPFRQTGVEGLVARDRRSDPKEGC